MREQQALTPHLYHLVERKADQRNGQQRREGGAHVAVAIGTHHDVTEAAAAGHHFRHHRNQHGYDGGDLDAVIERSKRQRQDDALGDLIRRQNEQANRAPAEPAKKATKGYGAKDRRALDSLLKDGKP